jgi:intein-encoded DNA endonuclease-like protein
MQKVFQQKSKQIAKLYLKGESSLSISRNLKIPVRTIITHLHMNNVNVRTPKEATSLALKTGRLKVKLTEISKMSHRLTKNKAYILGVLCGDGWIYYNNKSPKQTYQVGLDATNKDFVNKFSNCLYKVYGLKARRTKRKRRNVNWQIIFVSKICSKKVCDDLLLLGSFKTKIWRIPKKIFNAKPKIKASFLEGFFDSEGCVDKYTRRITGSSINNSGLQDVQNLLNSFKIRNKIRFSKSRIYNIVIEDRKSMECFANHIRFSINYKQLRLEEVLNSYKDRPKRSVQVDKLISKMKFLRKDGEHYKEISKKLNMGVGTVWKRLNEGLSP